MTESRSINLSVEVPGSPEEVWAAIATGPGITSWFVPVEVEGHVDGPVTMDFGNYGESTAKVTAWEPPHRVVFQGDGERPLAYEWLVEARDGGTCVVRLVNSGFGTGEDWDGDYDSMTHGWKIFLQNLRLQLAHFRGRRSRTFVPTVTLPGRHATAWSTLCESLGISGTLRAGDRLTLSGEDVPDLSGTVETIVAASPAATAYMLLLDDPVPGTAFVAAEGDGEQVACSLYLYLYGTGTSDDVGTTGDDWTAWLTSRVPPLEAHLES